MSWNFALERVLETIYAQPAEEKVQWAVVGSVASVLQGCQIDPGDLDLLAREPEDVYGFAGLMKCFAPASCEHPPGHTQWQSSASLPVTSGPDEYGFTWHFGRWRVAGFEVEMAHISPPEGLPASSDGAGIWEAGPEIWSFIKPIQFLGFDAQVVPLEIQLQTCLQRGLTERADEIIRVLQHSGADRELALQSLSRENGAVLERL